MKITVLATLAVGGAEAFTCGRRFGQWRPAALRAAAVESDFATAMPAEVDPLERIGIKEEELAIGIDPADVIEHIGSREDLVVKAMADIPSFDRAKAESEVDKFLLDFDALTVFIEFQKRKAEDPDFEVPPEEKEGFFSLRTFVFVYLAYVAYTSVPEAYKNWVRTKQEAGEWNGSGVAFIDKWLAESDDIVGAASDAAAQSADVVEPLQSVDAINVEGLADALQSVAESIN